MVDPQRPKIVTALGVLVVLAAVLLLIGAIADVILINRPGDLQRLFGRPVSDTFWIVSATVSVFMALVYLWVSRAVFDGNPLGHMLVNIVAVINLIFGVLLIAEGAGWGEILVNVVILILNNTKASRDWFATF